MRKMLYLAALLCAALPVCAQTVTVSASNLQDGGQPAKGTIYWKPVLASGQSASYRKPGGGITTVTPVSAVVTSGAFTLTLPCVDQTNPQWIDFSVTLNTAAGSVLGPGFATVQPHCTPSGSADWCQYVSGSSGPVVCNFDNYSPNIPALAQVVPAGVWSINGAQGSFNFTGPGFEGCTTASGVTTCTFEGGGPGGGNTLWNGTTAPSNSLGANGDFYLNTATTCLYGPKASGAWPGTCTSMIGPQGATGATGAQGPQGAAGATGATGPQGPSGGSTNWRGTWSSSSSYAVYDAVAYSGSSYIATVANMNFEPDVNPAKWQLLAQAGATGATGTAGTNGNTVWNGTSAPSSGTGVNGDFYLNTATSCLYGPKASGSWPGTCTSLIGPQGTTGATGATGTAGTNGNTIWNGTSAPSSGTGANGDFYLNTATSCLYGPKASGSWPGTCTPLVGVSTTTKTTTSSVTVGSAMYEFFYNQDSTASAAITYTLPAAQAGMQKCFFDDDNGSAATNGTLTLQTSGSGQYIIYTDGTYTASGGYVISGGAAGDGGCLVGQDPTHWKLFPYSVTLWTKH